MIRFNQPGYKVYLYLEQLLIKAAKKGEYETEIKVVIDFYKADFDLENNVG